MASRGITKWVRIKYYGEFSFGEWDSKRDDNDFFFLSLRFGRAASDNAMSFEHSQWRTRSLDIPMDDK